MGKIDFFQKTLEKKQIDRKFSQSKGKAKRKLRKLLSKINQCRNPTHFRSLHPDLFSYVDLF
jgi:hypothetical protein